MLKFEDFPNELREIGKIYAQIYTNYQWTIELIKKKISQLTVKEREKLQKQIEIFKGLRSYYLKYFSYPEVSSICARCQGLCCYWKKDGYIKLIDLIYAISINPNFQLPQPDPEFILEKVEKEKSNNVCIFLNSEGCQLKDLRPHTCLFFMSCYKLRVVEVGGTDAGFSEEIVRYYKFLQAVDPTIRSRFYCLEREIFKLVFKYLAD